MTEAMTASGRGERSTWMDLKTLHGMEFTGPGKAWVRDPRRVSASAGIQEWEHRKGSRISGVPGEGWRGKSVWT